jgi:hypothetical protein
VLSIEQLFSAIVNPSLDKKGARAKCEPKSLLIADAAAMSTFSSKSRDKTKI